MGISGKSGLVLCNINECASKCYCIVALDTDGIALENEISLICFFIALIVHMTVHIWKFA